MPELPEVETIVRGLQKKVTGKKIDRVEVRYNKIFRDCCGRPFSDQELADVLKSLEGRSIAGIRRRGKYIIFDLGGLLLLIHLRMTGKFSSEPGLLSDKHTHIVFYFTDKGFLAYNDIRKFGTFQIICSQADYQKATVSRLGPEPLGDDFTLEYFLREMKESMKNIKAFLLTQEKIAGIGNIYADEILFFAGIDPERLCNTIDQEEAQRLYLGIREKLLLGIDAGGASIRNYVNESGEKGRFQELLKVYGKKGCRCPRCGNELKVKTVAGRTSTFCPECQK